MSQTKEGWLFKQSGGGFRSWNQRYVRLEKDLADPKFSWFKKFQDKTAIQVLSLSSETLVDDSVVQTANKGRYCFSIVYSGKNYLFASQDMSVAQSWVSEIREAMEMLSFASSGGKFVERKEVKKAEKPRVTDEEIQRRRMERRRMQADAGSPARESVGSPSPAEATPVAQARHGPAEAGGAVVELERDPEELQESHPISKVSPIKPDFHASREPGLDESTEDFIKIEQEVAETGSASTREVRDAPESKAEAKEEEQEEKWEAESADRAQATEEDSSPEATAAARTAAVVEHDVEHGVEADSGMPRDEPESAAVAEDKGGGEEEKEEIEAKKEEGDIEEKEEEKEEEEEEVKEAEGEDEGENEYEGLTQAEYEAYYSGDFFTNAENSEDGGVFVWVIDQMHPFEAPEDEIGVFKSNECYLVLDVQKAANTLLHQVFYWIGKDASSDKIGSVAIWAVNLAKRFGKDGIQQRIEQGGEPAAFKSLFPAVSIVDEEPGASSLRHVSQTKAAVMYTVDAFGESGVIREADVGPHSLYAKECYVVYQGRTLIQFLGNGYNAKQMAKCISICNTIKEKDLHGSANVTQLRTTDPIEDFGEFFTILGCPKGSQRPDLGNLPAKPKSNLHLEDDEDSGADGGGKKLSLYWVYENEETHALQMSAIEERPLQRKMLLHDDSFILVTPSHIFVWIGKGASDLERVAGMQIATELRGTGTIPQDILVQRVIDMAEPAEFIANFNDWHHVMLPKDQGELALKSKVAPRTEEKELDVGEMVKRIENKKKIERKDIEGKVKIYRIADSKPDLVDEDDYGHFYARDGFIVSHETKERFKIYIWKGRDSSPLPVLSYRFMLMDPIRRYLEQTGGGVPEEEFINQGQEPIEFLDMFDGQMCVHAGGKSRLFIDSVIPPNEANLPKLYQVAGPPNYPAMACQIDRCTSNHLNSRDCFVLRAPKQDGAIYLWAGSGAVDVVRTAALDLAFQLQEDDDDDLQAFDEGEEPPLFWEAFEYGGKQDYPGGKELLVGGETFSPRLFRCSFETGAFDANEVPMFSQVHLVAEETFILDAGNTVFIWIGSHAPKAALRRSKDLAKAFAESCSNDGLGRASPLEVVEVKSGEEPDLFTAQFHGWRYSARKPARKDPYEARSRNLLNEIYADRMKKKKAEKEWKEAFLKADEAEIDRLWQEAEEKRKENFETEAGQKDKHSELADMLDTTDEDRMERELEKSLGKELKQQMMLEAQDELERELAAELSAQENTQSDDSTDVSQLLSRVKM